MKGVLQVFKGEIFKQNQNYYNSWQNYISLGIWPILNSICAYFMYKSFNLFLIEKYGIDTNSKLMIFIFTGLLGYNCFWSMVQSALFMQNERENGTLEIVFLTPANRLAIVYGRALGGIIQNVWMFSVFSILIIAVNKGITLRTLVCIPIGFLLLLIAAVIWGGFINAIFLVSRDVEFWFNICDSPMDILSGSKMPVSAFPVFLQSVSAIFPLTHCLIIIRSIFSESTASIGNWLSLLLIQLILISATKIILHLAEKHNRKTGNLQLY